MLIVQNRVPSACIVQRAVCQRTGLSSCLHYGVLAYNLEETERCEHAAPGPEAWAHLVVRLLAPFLPSIHSLVCLSACFLTSLVRPPPPSRQFRESPRESVQSLALVV